MFAAGQNSGSGSQEEFGIPQSLVVFVVKHNLLEFSGRAVITKDLIGLAARNIEIVFRAPGKPGGPLQPSCFVFDKGIHEPSGSTIETQNAVVPRGPDVEVAIRPVVQLDGPVEFALLCGNEKSFELPCFPVVSQDGIVVASRGK